MKKEKTVRERVEAICSRETRDHNYTSDKGFTIYRLAQLLRVHKGTLIQEKPASSLLDWALRRCEEEGMNYYERMEEKLGTFGLKK